jgi:hypothetical protein
LGVGRAGGALERRGRRLGWMAEAVVVGRAGDALEEEGGG